MKKIALLAIFFAFTLSACTTFHNSVPQDMTGRLPANSSTSIKVLGKTEGKADVITLFGFFVLPEGDKVGAFSGDSGKMISFFPNAKTIAEEAAVYKSLETYPAADRVLDPTFKTVVQNYFIFQRAQSTVQGTAAQFNY